MPVASIPLNSPVQDSKKIEITRPRFFTNNMSLGEILPAEIIEKTAGGKYIISVRNTHLPASSGIPLKPGEKILLRVESLNPQIIFHAVTNENSSSAVQFHEILRQWQSNPESILRIFNNVAQLAEMMRTGSWPLLLGPHDGASFLQLFDSIIFSSRTKHNPLFLKDFVGKSGLLLESTLQQLAAKSAAGMREKTPADNLKSLLLKLAASLEPELRNKSGYTPENAAKLLNIHTLVQESLKMIETNQLLNAAVQDSDGGLVLQVPVAVAEGFRLADIFITTGKDNQEGKKRSSSFTVFIFLDLDILGEIAVHAGMREEGFHCVIKCARPGVRDLVNGQMERLKNSLEAVGYRVDHLNCLLEEGLRRQRNEFMASQYFPHLDLLNFFV